MIVIICAYMVYLLSTVSVLRGTRWVPLAGVSLKNKILNTVFLALKKVGVRQYEDSDSKPGFGVSTLVRHAAASSEHLPKVVATLGGSGPLGEFFFRKGFRSLSRDIWRDISSFETTQFSLMKHWKISLEMISENLLINFVRMECFFVRGGSLSSELTTWRHIRNTATVATPQ